MYSDEEILTSLSGGKASELGILEYLYSSNIKAITSLILKNNGQVTDAEDILQDAIIVLYEKIKKGGFRLQSALSTYIYSVSKFIWLNQLRKNKRVSHVSDFLFEEDKSIVGEEIQEIFHYDQEQFIGQLFEKVGDDCKKVLVMSIYHKAPMKEIAELMDYKNEQIARNKKTKCLGKLRAIVKDSPKYQSIIKSLLS